MGCNCGKSNSAQVSGGSARRITVYQALGSDGTVTGEFSSLPEARIEATKISGRVKVTSKIV